MWLRLAVPVLALSSPLMSSVQQLAYPYIEFQTVQYGTV